MMYHGTARALASERRTLCRFFEAIAVVTAFFCLTNANNKEGVVKRENTEAVTAQSKTAAYSTNTQASGVFPHFYHANTEIGSGTATGGDINNTISDLRQAYSTNIKYSNVDNHERNTSAVEKRFRVSRDVTPAQCASGWIRGGAWCFRLTPPETWNATQQECHTSNGLLAEISSREEQDELRDFLNSQVTPVERAWIGLSDRYTGQRLKWISGKNVTFFNWNIGQPNLGDHGENCVSTGTGEQWDVEDCYDVLSGVCQKEPCDPGWTLKGELCYLLTGEEPWHDAQDTCRSMNGSLAEVFNANEQSTLNNYLQNTGVGSGRVWIGLSDLQTKGQWVWNSGRNAIYSNWKPGEPSSLSQDEDCVDVWSAETMSKWNDENCNYTRKGVCQKFARPCDPEWTLLEGGFCYKLTSEASWHGAQEICQSMNSSLAEIFTNDEQSSLNNFLKSEGPWKVWIGLRDRQSEGKWVWNSGRNATYTNWNLGEPSNGSEHCVAVWPSGAMSQWNDEWCYKRLNGICQKKACGLSGWTLKGEFCYRLTPPTLHVKAQDICRSWGASLAEIFTSTQQYAVQDFMKLQEEPVASRAWIGLTDELTKGVWSWASGRKLTQKVFWIKKEPNNAGGDEHCGAVWPEYSWEWNDAPCNLEYPGVCMRRIECVNSNEVICQSLSRRDCADSNEVICQSLSRRGLCFNSLFKSYMEVACPQSCGRCG